MSEQAHPDLRRALALSAQMLDAARLGDWPRATSLQGECDQLIRGAPINTAGIMAMRQLQLDQQSLLALAAQARDEVSDQLRRHRGNHRAVSAYLHTADPG